MVDSIDYTQYLIDINDNLVSLNRTDSGLNESLNRLIDISNQSAYMMEIILYLCAVAVIIYVVGVMLKITFSR